MKFGSGTVFGWKRAYDLPALTRRYYVFKWIGLVLCAWFAFAWLKTPVSEKNAPHFAKIHINMSPAKRFYSFKRNFFCSRLRHIGALGGLFCMRSVGMVII